MKIDITDENLHMASSDENYRPNGIVITPTILVGIIVVLMQFMIGFSLWAIKDRLQRYDALEPRISSIEKNLIQYNEILTNFNKFSEEFQSYIKEPKLTEQDYNARTTEKLQPIKEQLNRIESKILEKTDNIENALDKRMTTYDASIEKFEDRIRNIETQVEVLKQQTKK